MRMRTKRFGVLMAVGILALTPLSLGLIESLFPRASAFHTREELPKLETFMIMVETAELQRNAVNAPPPRAVIAVKVLVTNIGMEEKKDVLVRIALENERGELVAENSMLVYVPHLKTNGYTINLLTREGGNLSVVAEVVSSGRAAVAEPVTLSVSGFDLLI